MKKLLVLLFVLGISTQLFANIKAKQVVGKWTYTVETDQGNLTGFLKFTEKEGKLTGEVISSDGGVYPMKKVEIQQGNQVFFTLVPDYDEIKITIKIEGKKYKGSGSTYDGDFPIVGEKTE